MLLPGQDFGIPLHDRRWVRGEQQANGMLAIGHRGLISQWSMGAKTKTSEIGTCAETKDQSAETNMLIWRGSLLETRLLIDKSRQNACF